MGDTTEASKASATQIDMNTMLENVESMEIEMETITDVLSLPVVEGRRRREPAC